MLLNLSRRLIEGERLFPGSASCSGIANVLSILDTFQRQIKQMQNLLMQGPPLSLRHRRYRLMQFRWEP